MALSPECYADTSAFIGFLDSGDQYHAFFRHLFAEPPPLVTSALVVAEGHGWFLRRYDPRRAEQFLQFIKDFEDLRIQPFDVGELVKAHTIVKRYHDQKIAMADAHGLAIMADRRIRSCWSTDRHLSLSGVPLVITVQ